MSSREFPNDLFLISIWPGGGGWFASSASAILCPDGLHIVVERGQLAGPSGAEEELIAKLQHLAIDRGYGKEEIVIKRYGVQE